MTTRTPNPEGAEIINIPAEHATPKPMTTAEAAESVTKGEEIKARRARGEFTAHERMMAERFGPTHPFGRMIAEWEAAQ